MTQSEKFLRDGEYQIDWPAGRSVELGEHLLPTKMGALTHVDNIAPIQKWCQERGFPLLDMPTNARRINLLALDGDELVGEIAIDQVNEEPVSFSVVTCVGRNILDESWADIESLPSCLDQASRLIHERHKQRSQDNQPEWRFAFGSKEDNCTFVPDDE